MSSTGRCDFFFLQFLLTYWSGDGTVTPVSSWKLETYKDNLPHETKRSPCEAALEETQAESPILTAQILLSKTNMIKMALTITVPTNFARCF